MSDTSETTFMTCNQSVPRTGPATPLALQASAQAIKEYPRTPGKTSRFKDYSIILYAFRGNFRP